MGGTDGGFGGLSAGGSFRTRGLAKPLGETGGRLSHFGMPLLPQEKDFFHLLRHVHGRLIRAFDGLC
jgi:hypothetical protein